ncbi:class I SAM-dependent methyltransferase [Mycolicibacterium thermoresistibile]
MSTQVEVSSLFTYLEGLRGEQPWGEVLDAGTGVHSLEWITGLQTTSWTAITADRGMAAAIRRAVGAQMRPQDRLLVGNWVNDSLLTGETFDAILVDYLIGAIEGFAPYWQDRVFERLRPLINADGRLYIIGLEPYVQFEPETESGHIVWEIGRVRDACLLLAGQRPYREYPADWVMRHLGRAGFRMLECRHFPNRYHARFVNSQLDMCINRLQRLPSGELAEPMRRYVEDLRRRALDMHDREGGLAHGADYVIVAAPR